MGREEFPIEEKDEDEKEKEEEEEPEINYILIEGIYL